MSTWIVVVAARVARAQINGRACRSIECCAARMGLSRRSEHGSCTTEVAAYAPGVASVAQADGLEIVLAGWAAAIAIDGRGAGFAFAIGAAILLAFVRRTTTTCVGTLL